MPWVRAARGALVIACLVVGGSLATSCGGGNLGSCQGPSGAVNCASGKVCQWTGNADSPFACVDGAAADAKTEVCGSITCQTGTTYGGGCACLSDTGNICRCTPTGG
jgi:hypothetical protein